MSPITHDELNDYERWAQAGQRMPSVLFLALVNEVRRLRQSRCDWDCDSCHAHQQNCLDTCDEYCPGDHDE